LNFIVAACDDPDPDVLIKHQDALLKSLKQYRIPVRAVIRKIILGVSDIEVFQDWLEEFTLDCKGRSDGDDYTIPLKWLDVFGQVCDQVVQANKAEAKIKAESEVKTKVSSSQPSSSALYESSYASRYRRNTLELRTTPWHKDNFRLWESELRTDFDLRGWNTLLDSQDAVVASLNESIVSQKEVKMCAFKCIFRSVPPKHQVAVTSGLSHDDVYGLFKALKVRFEYFSLSDKMIRLKRFLSFSMNKDESVLSLFDRFSQERAALRQMKLPFVDDTTLVLCVLLTSLPDRFSTFEDIIYSKYSDDELGRTDVSKLMDDIKRELYSADRRMTDRENNVPTTVLATRATTAICFSWRDKGTCRHGDNCRFNHSGGGRTSSNSKKRNKNKCGYCGIPGHSEKVCRKKKKANQDQSQDEKGSGKESGFSVYL
jgi:hypothetical protein